MAKYVTFIWDKDNPFVLDLNTLRWTLKNSGSSLKEEVAGRHVTSPGHIILIQANQSLFLLLNVALLAEGLHIYFYSLWFYLILARTFDLPHSRQAR
jgi:hypothetical protein